MLLMALWGFSSLAKILWPDPSVITHTVVLAGLPRALGPLGYWGLAAAEGVVAVLLAAPRKTVPALWLSLVLAGVLIAARIAFGDIRKCACFGALETPTWLSHAVLLCAFDGPDAGRGHIERRPRRPDLPRTESG